MVGECLLEGNGIIYSKIETHRHIVLLSMELQVSYYCWITPDGITLPTSDKEEISPETWALLESNGAVFLPYVGHSKYYEYQTNLYRHSITQVNVSGSYYINNNNYRVHDTMGIWTSAYIYNITAEAANWIEVDQRAVGSKGIKSYLGAVRLVQDYVKE